MDGVIVDSMPYHFIAWYEALLPFGARVSCFDVYTREGEHWRKSLKDLLRKSGIQPSEHILKKIFLRRKRVFSHYFKRHIFSGVKELLSCLAARGYSLGLVSGTPLSEIKKILPCGILGFFDCVVAGDQVKKGKPHPRPYLEASRALGVRPDECVVIENAPLGIASAKAAGMFTIALTTSLPKEYLREADMVIDELEEASGIVDKSCLI